MKVMFKSGSKHIIQAAIPTKVIRRKMEGILAEHPHLCATCSSTACGRNRGFNSDFVYSAVRTYDRDYIFGCIAYRKRKASEEFGIIPSDDSVYVPDTYRIIHPTVKEYVRKMK